MKKIKIIDSKCIYDFCGNSGGSGAWADIYKTKEGYFVGVMDGDNQKNCGLFSINEKDYEKLSNFDFNFDTLYQQYIRVEKDIEFIK